MRGTPDAWSRLVVPSPPSAPAPAPQDGSPGSLLSRPLHLPASFKHPAGRARWRVNVASSVDSAQDFARSTNFLVAEFDQAG
jgi:hypothetical protein